MMFAVFKIFFFFSLNHFSIQKKKKKISYSASLVIGIHEIKVESRLAKTNCSMFWAYGAAYEWVLTT